jgi:hypothetical protein
MIRHSKYCVGEYKKDKFEDTKWVILEKQELFTICFQ